MMVLLLLQVSDGTMSSAYEPSAQGQPASASLEPYGSGLYSICPGLSSIDAELRRKLPPRRLRRLLGWFPFQNPKQGPSTALYLHFFQQFLFHHHGERKGKAENVA